MIQRRGPRPLLLHLTLAMLRSSVSRATSLNWKHDWPNLNAATIRQALTQHSADTAFPIAVWTEALRQDAALIHGITAYRRHPWRRDIGDPPVVWSEGGSRLLDYGGTGPTVLFVPSLINGFQVLDLMADHSMLRWLAANGTRPLLLDWGWPDATERGFTLTDYIAGRLERTMAEAARLTGGPIILAGYCMGGLLAVAAAQRRPDLTHGLALLATPWDFHAPTVERAREAAGCLALIEPALELLGAMPVDALQMLFALLDPWGVADKYRAFAALPTDSPRAHRFVALEDWLNDGMPLAAPVARECLSAWYGANTPARGLWRVAGQIVDPSALRLPVFVAIPQRDRIVPPDSALALARLIPEASTHSPAAGHVGMVAGAAAQRQLWEPLLAWLLSQVHEGG